VGEAFRRRDSRAAPAGDRHAAADWRGSISCGGSGGVSGAGGRRLLVRRPREAAGGDRAASFPTRSTHQSRRVSTSGGLIMSDPRSTATGGQLTTPWSRSGRSDRLERGKTGRTCDPIARTTGSGGPLTWDHHVQGRPAEPAGRCSASAEVRKLAELLASMPVPPMPAGLATRIEGAIAAEAASRHLTAGRRATACGPVRRRELTQQAG
jgi:hypothetical protein